MKFSEVKARQLASEISSVEIMRNPANLNEWVVWIRDAVGRSFLLTDEENNILAMGDMNKILVLLQSLDIKQISIIL